MADRELAGVIGANVARLRDERDWSQSQLAALIRSQGLRKWSPGSVGLIETGGQRADRLLDLLALTRVFGVTMDELLEPTDEVKVVPVAGPEPMDLARLQAMLRGNLKASDTGPLAEDEDPYKLARIARLVDLDVGRFRMAVRAVFGRGTFAELRDERAGITIRPGTARNIQARRAAATKALLAELRAHIEREGIETLMEFAVQDISDAATSDPDPED